MAVEAVVIGGGNRGRGTYGTFARAHPDRLRVIAIAEAKDDRREAMAREHALPGERVFRDWRALLELPRLAPVAIVATSDTEHVEPALAAIARGYHLLLEKPMAPDAGDCLRVVEAAEKAGRLLQISHVLRYTTFYDRVREILDSGRLGRIVHIDMKEHVAYWHMTHSFVRGKFRNRALAAPIVLAKTCHDLDLMVWFVGAAASRVASFGSLSEFRVDRAPAGAPARCTDGCPVQANCPHDAERFYLGPDESYARMWPWIEVSFDPSREARRRALETGPYGVCVYRSDNDVADHQVLAIEFENGVHGTFTLNGLGSHERRTIRITGTEGELRGVFQDGLLEVSRHGAFAAETITLPASAAGHYGGDEGLLHHFTDIVSSGRLADVRASGRVALDSHLLGFAAEEARLTGRVVELSAVHEAARREAGMRS